MCQHGRYGGALEIIVGSNSHSVTSLVISGLMGVHGCSISVDSEG